MDGIMYMIKFDKFAEISLHGWNLKLSW
jgi:hypothetical protein